MDLKELIKEINYQDTFSYEKRVDLFNKYIIPTHLNFFNPIYELAKFITDKRSYSISKHSSFENFGMGDYNCYSHSGNVASSFNTDFNVDFKSNKANTVKVYNSGSIRILGYDRTQAKYIPILDFNIDKTITVHIKVTIPRNLYSLIDEWLIDFGYKSW